MFILSTPIDLKNFSLTSRSCCVCEKNPLRTSELLVSTITVSPVSASSNSRKPILGNSISRGSMMSIDIISCFLLATWSDFSYSSVKKSDIFLFFLWALIIVAVFRLIFIIKKKLFWKVRNRLIFSGLFFMSV